MNKRWKWIVSLGTVFLVVFFSGYHFLKPYYRFRFSAVEVTKVNAMTTIRKVIPGGPARFLSQDGDYIVGIGQVSSLDTDWAVYLYDMNGTISDLNDDFYTTVYSADEGTIYSSVVNGDYITWIFKETPCNEKGILYSYKISTQSLVMISSDVIRGFYSRYNNYVVFSFDGINDYDIRLYNLTNNSSTDICTASDDQTFPCIFDNTITWTDNRNKQMNESDIYRYDISNSQEYPVATTSYSEYDPITSGNWIIYTKKTNNSNDIRKYDISLQADSLLATIPIGNIYTFRDINLDYFVYTKKDINGTNLYLYNLDESINIFVDSSSSNIFAVIGSTQLVYNVLSSPNISYTGSVYGYDIENESNYSIRTTGETSYEISIDKDTDYLIMTSKGVDNDPDEWDVSLATLP